MYRAFQQYSILQTDLETAQAAPSDEHKELENMVD